MENNLKNWEKLASYFSREQSPGAHKALDQERQLAPPEEQALFDVARNLWDKTALSPKEDFQPDPEAAWQRVQLKVAMRQKTTRVFPWRVAAVVTMLTVSIAVLLIVQSQSPKPTSPEIAEAAPEIIEIASLKEVTLTMLPDGSRVWLSPNTTLTYSKAFNLDHREVSLSGKAFFEIEKAQGRRFTVLTEHTKTEVLGTSFNLETKQNGQVKVQVTTGKVAFTAREEAGKVYLEPGQQAMYTEGQHSITPEAIDDPNYRAWQNQKLTFSNTSLKSMARVLSEHYQTTISVPEELTNCRFTVSFERKGLQDVIEILEITGDLKASKTENGYLFSGKKCN